MSNAGKPRPFIFHGAPFMTKTREAAWTPPRRVPRNIKALRSLWSRRRSWWPGGDRGNCGVCAAYKSYDIPGALEVAVAPREGLRIRTPSTSARPARGLIPPPRRRSLRLCARCYDVGIADFPATATLLASTRPCIITSKVKKQVMGSMDQRVPWNQFTREAKVGHSGSPVCDCGGIRRRTCYKKCTSARPAPRHSAHSCL
jgi:hypothetical protein